MFKKKYILRKVIKIPNQHHLVAWLRFINECRPSTKRFNKRDLIKFDLTNTGVIQPHQITSLACLIEEYKNKGAKIEILTKKKTPTGLFISGTQFSKYWNKDFNRNICLEIGSRNIIPIWQYSKEKIDSYANLILDFYSAHAIKGKDLTPLRLTVVEALNNINDHSNSNVGGFIYTQYFPKTCELIISICDFGIGIPKKVQGYYRVNSLGKISDVEALKKAMELNFTTGSMPYNAGKGLDTILSNVNAANGEIIIISNSAFYSKAINNGKIIEEIDKMNLNFNGTNIKVKLNTSEFLDQAEEEHEEMSLF